MTQRVTFSHGEPVGLLAVVVGVLVIVLPIVYLGPGGFGIGPIGFAVLMMEVVMGIVGLAILGTGIYSYRTGNPRPAIAAVTIICSLTIVGGIGAYIEMTGAR